MQTYHLKRVMAPAPESDCVHFQHSTRLTHFPVPGFPNTPKGKEQTGNGTLPSGLSPSLPPGGANHPVDPVPVPAPGSPGP